MSNNKKTHTAQGDVTVEIPGTAALGLAGFSVAIRGTSTPPTEDLEQASNQILLGADLLASKGVTEHGQLIQYIEIPWLAIANELERDPQFALQLDPRRFEEFIAASYDREGWQVELTPRSGDGGRDIIATRNDFGSLRIYDEVKRYASDHRVSAEKVRALSGVINGYQNVSKGVLTTTSQFAPGVWTDPSIAPLMPHRLELRDGARLLEWIQHLKNPDA